jgi:hypothetical protein
LKAEKQKTKLALISQHQQHQQQQHQQSIPARQFNEIEHKMQTCQQPHPFSLSVAAPFRDQFGGLCAQSRPFSETQPLASTTAYFNSSFQIPFNHNNQFSQANFSLASRQQFGSMSPSTSTFKFEFGGFNQMSPFVSNSAFNNQF